MDQLKPKQKDDGCRQFQTNTRARQHESKNHDCSFTVAEKALLAKVHLQMAEALKKKGKAERAGIMQDEWADYMRKSGYLITALFGVVNFSLIVER